MTSVTARQDDVPVRQNWVLGPAQDWLLIIGAPVLGVLFTVFLFQQAGLRGVLLAISIYNIAHHFPTFVRIYGDRRLMERFKWSLLLGPVIPLALAMGTVVFVIQSGLDHAVPDRLGDDVFGRLFAIQSQAEADVPQGNA